jgi:hypothetical protein
VPRGTVKTPQSFQGHSGPCQGLCDNPTGYLTPEVRSGVPPVGGESSPDRPERTSGTKVLVVGQKLGRFPNRLNDSATCGVRFSAPGFCDRSASQESHYDAPSCTLQRANGSQMWERSGPPTRRSCTDIRQRATTEMLSHGMNPDTALDHHGGISGHHGCGLHALETRTTTR